MGNGRMSFDLVNSEWWGVGVAGTQDTGYILYNFFNNLIIRFVFVNNGFKFVVF
jgi:hypothetical protein